MRKLIGWGLIIVAVALVVTWWHVAIAGWMVVHFGIDPGPWNLYWGGFGSVMPWSLGIFAGIIGLYRHHNCHVKGCPRLGKAVDGTPYLACPKHHPEHEGKNRAVSLETIHRAHRMRQYR